MKYLNEKEIAEKRFSIVDRGLFSLVELYGEEMHLQHITLMEGEHRLPTVIAEVRKITAEREISKEDREDIHTYLINSLFNSIKFFKTNQL